MVRIVILVQPGQQLGVRGTAAGAAQCPADLCRLAVSSSPQPVPYPYFWWTA